MVIEELLGGCAGCAAGAAATALLVAAVVLEEAPVCAGPRLGRGIEGVVAEGIPSLRRAKKSDRRLAIGFRYFV